MPTINLYFNDDQVLPQLRKVTQALKSYVADQLTCGDRKLDLNEVSVRFIPVLGAGMLASVELEITAAAYNERVEKQDEICLNIQRFILDNIAALKDTQVWLILCELGHSFED